MKTLINFRIPIVILIVIIFVCLDMYRNRGVQFIRKPSYLSKEEIDSRVNEYFNRHMTQRKKILSQNATRRKEIRDKKKQELLKKTYESEKREDQEELLIRIEELIIEEFSENE